MKKTAVLLSVMMLAASPVFAAQKTYQVTGPVTAMEGGTITVKKGSESWEIATGSVAVPADVKVGSKVTVEYTMTAATITSKDKGSAKKK